MLLKIIRKPLIYSSSFIVQMRKTEAQRGKMICSRSHSKSVSSTFSQTRSNEDSHYMTSTSQPSLPAALGWIGAGTNTLSLEDMTVKGVLLPGCSWCLQRGVPPTHHPLPHGFLLAVPRTELCKATVWPGIHTFCTQGPYSTKEVSTQSNTFSTWNTSFNLHSDS